MTQPPIIAVTPGEPAGIGPDLCVRIAQDPPDAVLVFIADPWLLAERAQSLGTAVNLDPWIPTGRTKSGAWLLAVEGLRGATAGRPDRANAAYVLGAVERAIDGCLKHEFDALVTGPVHKGVINDAGLPFSGHTEFLAERTGTAQPVMMLACPGLRVALATTHLPLTQVPRAVTRERLTRVIEVLHDDLRDKLGIARPCIVVCGVNPHAGESGHLGREEIDVVVPVIELLRARGLRLRGPVPADSAFVPRQMDGVDAVLAMYHDQGLPVIKHHDFGHAVNITLGLPFVRTSVDHGTALELAGTGRADATSLRAAIDMAIEMVHAAQIRCKLAR